MLASKGAYNVSAHSQFEGLLSAVGTLILVACIDRRIIV